MQQKSENFCPHERACIIWHVWFGRSVCSACSIMWTHLKGKSLEQCQFVLLKNTSFEEFKILKQCTEPTLTYDAQMWAPTRAQVNKLRTTHNRMVRSIPGIQLKDRILIKALWYKSGMTDIRWTVKKLKLSYVGHLATGDNNRWNKALEAWSFIDQTRGKGKSPTSWRDKVSGYFSTPWQRVARVRAT